MYIDFNSCNFDKFTFSSSNFCGGFDSLDYFIHTILSTAKKTGLFFLIFILLFFSYIVVLERASNILLNSCGDSGYLVLELRSSQYFTIKYDIYCCLFIYAHYQVDGIPFFPSVLRVFLSWMGMTLCQKCLHQLKFFFFDVFNGMNYSLCFHIVKSTLILS